MKDSPYETEDSYLNNITTLFLSYSKVVFNIYCNGDKDAA